MPKRVKLAVNWAAACGGCDVSLLDLEEGLLELAAVADIVYWPVAMDFKRADLKALGPGEIDVGIFNGAIRTSEQAEDALLLRERCKVLVAYGSCAAFGGIPGLANLVSRTELLATVYDSTASTENPDQVRPQVRSEVDGHTLELPLLHDSVKALSHVVEVDLVIPGCPPPPGQVEAAAEVIQAVARGEPAPPAGTVLASDKALCDECPRAETRTASRLTEIRRPHQVMADPDLCFLEQGLLCLGMATRGGCGGSCLEVNMPCRGCFGPTAAALDPAAETLSAIGSVAAKHGEDDLTPPQRLAVVRSVADVAGTFYRFTLPSSVLFRRANDGHKE